MENKSGDFLCPYAGELPAIVQYAFTLREKDGKERTSLPRMSAFQL